MNIVIIALSLIDKNYMNVMNEIEEMRFTDISEVHRVKIVKQHDILRTEFILRIEQNASIQELRKLILRIIDMIATYHDRARIPKYSVRIHCTRLSSDDNTLALDIINDWLNSLV